MRFEFLDKANADSVYRELYLILHTNMERIDPIGLSYGEGLDFWMKNALPKILNDPSRQVLLIYDGDCIAGYFMYSVSGNLLAMEDIQFRDEYKGSGMFRELYIYLVSVLPDGIEYVEALASKKNVKSQSVLLHHGLEIIGENKSGRSWRFRGEYRKIAEKYGSKNN